MRVLLDDMDKVIGTVYGPQELVELNTPPNSRFVDVQDGTLIPPDSYLDVKKGKFVDIGLPPSPIHTFDYSVKQWIDPRTLDEIKDAKWSQIKAQRDAFENGGFEFQGHRYDSDVKSQGRIATAASLGMAVEWTLQDNSAIWLEPADLEGLMAALAIHVTSTHARGKIAREAIYAAKTKEEVESVNF